MRAVARRLAEVFHIKVLGAAFVRDLLAAVLARVVRDHGRREISEFPHILDGGRQRLRSFDPFCEIRRRLRHQVQAERYDELDVSDVLFLLRGGSLLGAVIFFRSREQRVRHLALVEQRVKFPQVGVVELLLPGEVAPEVELFRGHELLVLALPLGIVLHLDSNIDSLVSKVLVERLEVQVDLANVL